MGAAASELDFPFSEAGFKDAVKGADSGEVSRSLLWDSEAAGGLSDPLAFEFEEEKPKRGRKPSGDKPEPKVKASRGTASERELAEIGESLEEKMTSIGALLSGIAPVTSVYAVERSPRAIEALLSIAKRRPKVLAVLKKTADGVDALELAQFLGGLIIAMQVDAGRLKGNELPAQAFGVTAILEEYFSGREDEAVPNPAVNMQAPRFAGI